MGNIGVAMVELTAKELAAKELAAKAKELANAVWHWLVVGLMRMASQLAVRADASGLRRQAAS